MIYIIFFLIFGLGFLCGSISTYIQIRQYRKKLGMNPDPLQVSEIHFL